MFRERECLFSFLLAFTLSLPAWSQTITGNIRGVVNNSDGQPIAGAVVIISSDSLIGQTRSTTTNQLGVFRFPSIPVGIYSVQADLTGFESVRANNVEVSLAETSNVPLTMRMSQSEIVNVEARTQMIDTQSSGVPTTYNEEMIGALSTHGRMWTLMRVAPGVTVDVGDSQDGGLIAFGSNRQSNSWHIDGLDVTGPETGQQWVDTNPDAVQQIQIYGIGAPAEYGNHIGAAINVVIKQGSNDFHGALKAAFQTQALTDVNVRLPETDFVYHNDKYHNVSGQIGGPIAKDKLWFFGSIQTLRDGHTLAGVDPKYTPLFKFYFYDFKLTTRFKNLDLNAYLHNGQYNNPGFQNAYIEDSAVSYGSGSDITGSLRLTYSLQKDVLAEVGYAGFSSRLVTGSKTGSLEDQTITWDGIYTGGISYPYDWLTVRNQVDGKMTFYADNFLKSQHEFKFGVQFANRHGDTITSLGSNGTYSYVSYYGYTYTYYQNPFHYGAESKDLGFFLDDTVTPTSRLTLNLGIRFDHNTGSIPDYERLKVGTPSIVSIGNFKPTGEVVPGIKNIVNWNLISPRLGFVLQTRADGKAVLRGSFGVYYDHDVTGNWDVPPPGLPPTQQRICSSDGCQDLDPAYAFGRDARGNQLKAPRALQYSIGYEFQSTANSSISAQYIHKNTKDGIGWQIVGGKWIPFLFTDPFTGRQYTLLHPDPSAPATIQKGNDPGDFPGSERFRYFQKYDGLIIGFTKRFSDSWALNASYTWSRSYGLLSLMFLQNQFPAMFASPFGSDPNHFVNAEGPLQGDRPHMFRTQVVFFKLPWNLQCSSSIEFSSGRPYTRQIRVSEQGYPSSRVIMDHSSSLRHSPIKNIDLSIGKRFPIENRVRVLIDAEILNLLNSDQELRFANLVLPNPSYAFVPDNWVEPRRLQLLVALQF